MFHGMFGCYLIQMLYALILHILQVCYKCTPSRPLAVEAVGGARVAVVCDVVEAVLGVACRLGYVCKQNNTL